MAPEQALGQPIDARADLYALGIMAYEMLCGQRPFDDASKIRLLGMHVTAKVPPMAEKGGADVPAEVEAVIMRLLAKEATDRTPDAKTLGEELEGLQLLLIASGRIEGKLPTSYGGAAFVPGSMRMSGASHPQLDEAAAALGSTGSSGGSALLRDKRVIGGIAGGVLLLVVIVAVALSGGKKADVPKTGVVPTTSSVASAADSTEAPALEPAIDPSSTIELDPAASAAVPPISDPKIVEGLGAIEKGELAAGIALLEPIAQKASCPPQVHRAHRGAPVERRCTQDRAARCHSSTVPLIFSTSASASCGPRPGLLIRSTTACGGDLRHGAGGQLFHQQEQLVANRAAHGAPLLGSPQLGWRGR
jgi:serine/threonine-protein kinase